MVINLIKASASGVFVKKYVTLVPSVERFASHHREKTLVRDVSTGMLVREVGSDVNEPLVNRRHNLGTKELSTVELACKPYYLASQSSGRAHGFAPIVAVSFKI